MLSSKIFNYSLKNNIKLNILTFLIIQLCNVKCIHVVVQLSLLLMASSHYSLWQILSTYSLPDLVLDTGRMGMSQEMFTMHI